MADTKISAMTAGSALGGTEQIPAVQSAANVAVTPNQIKTYIGAGLSASSASDPTTSNDNTQGYIVGSTWVNTTTGALWHCVSSTTSAAVWIKDGPSEHPGYVVGSYYPPYLGAMAAGSALVANTAKFIPWIPEQDCTIASTNGVGVKVSTVGTTNLNVAIYASDPTTKLPTGSELQSTGNFVNTSATTVTASLGGTVSVKAGVLYWWGVNCGDSTCVTYQITNPGYVGWVLGGANSTILNNPAVMWISTPLTLGTWGNLTAATWTVTGSTSSATVVTFKIASIP